MIICGKCKTKNTPRRIFCVNCGAKLDLANIIFVRPSAGWRYTLKALKFLVVLAFIAAVVCFGFCLWPDNGRERFNPYEVTAERGGGKKVILSAAPLRYYQPLREKLARLTHAERLARETFTEQESNAFMAYFAAELNRQQSGARFLNEIAGCAITLTPQAVELLVLAHTRTVFGLGPWPLTFRLRGVPVASEDGFVFLVKGGALGRLPLPAGIIKWPARRVGLLFAASKPGQKAMALLNRALNFELSGGKILITFGTE